MADLKISALTASSTPLAGTEVLPIVQSGATVKVAVSNLTAGRSVSAGNLTVTTAATTALGSANITATDPTFRMSVSGGTADRNTYEFRAIAAGAGFDYLQLRKINDARTVFTELYKFDNDGNAALSTGNLVIGTSGKGIDFTATAGSGTSELLADYEEGTWSPTLTTTGTDFTSVTYAGSRIGRYTKVGRVVTVEGIMVTSAVTVGSASGTVRIGGLPFAPLAYGASIAVGYADGWSINVPIAGIFQSNSTIGLYYRALANGAAVDTPVSNVATGANGNYMYFSASYTT